MKETIAEIFKLFSHLARELQVYVFTGYILVINILYIDKYYIRCINNLEFDTFNICISIVAAYIIGHVCMAFYNFIFEITRIDKIFNCLFFSRRFPKKDISDEKILSDKASILIKNEKVYFHYIERNVNLSIMRWNYSAAFLIACILNIISYKQFNTSDFFYLSWFSGLASFCLMLLHIYTQKENVDQIEKLKAVLDENNSG